MRPEAGAHLWDAVEAAKLVHEFARGKTEADFTSDLVVRSAVERQLEILGEAFAFPADHVGDRSSRISRSTVRRETSCPSRTGARACGSRGPSAAPATWSMIDFQRSSDTSHGVGPRPLVLQ
jgi:hypothetical protein